MDRKGLREKRKNMLKEAVIQFRSVRGILSISVRNAPDSVRVEGGVRDHQIK